MVELRRVSEIKHVLDLLRSRIKLGLIQKPWLLFPRWLESKWFRGAIMKLPTLTFPRNETLRMSLEMSLVAVYSESVVKLRLQRIAITKRGVPSLGGIGTATLSSAS